MIPQTPWFERSFHFDFPVSLFPVIFSRLEGSFFRLQAILATADEEACSQSKNGWSVKEHLGHLSDLESLWWQRLQDFLDGKTTLTTADLTNRKTFEAGHNEKSLERLLQTFVIERQKMLEVIYSFDKGTLGLTSLHPRLQQPMRLIDSLYFVAEHDDHHIAKISALLRKPEDGFVE
ncbi:DinB family protein [Flavisolibacter sp. BT320]|nr:DinB family protein [Flavisolibacter longurius]